MVFAKRTDAEADQGLSVCQRLRKLAHAIHRDFFSAVKIEISPEFFF